MRDKRRPPVRGRDLHPGTYGGATYAHPPHRLSPVFVARFLEAHVVRDAGHWVWRGSVDHYGYGVTSFLGRQWKAHRLVWSFIEGPLSDEEVLHHGCGLRLCVFPGHLERFDSHGAHIAHEHRIGTYFRTQQKRGVRE